MATMPASSGGKPASARGGDDNGSRRGGQRGERQQSAPGGGRRREQGTAGGEVAKSGPPPAPGGRRRGGQHRVSATASAPSSNGGQQNLNHLLSFTLPPRVAPPSSHLPARRQRRTGASYVPFNKERYVNAQYRFLVKPTGDYTACFADSDIYLNWSDILTVLIPTSSALTTAHGSSSSALAAASQPHLEAREDAACPICLSPPTAPRMTKCGHVFCYPCILHYLTVRDAPAGSGAATPTPGFSLVPGAARPAAAPSTPQPTAAPKWKRCPVCWDAVYARDLKAVKWWDPKARAQEFESHEVGEESTAKSKDVLCMRLIERPHLTTLALPKSSTWPVASTSTSEQPLIAQHSAPWHFQPDVMTFSKFMLATPDQLLENLDSNLRELKEERELLTNFMTKDEVGLLFVEMAERKVHEQMEKVANELDTQAVRSRINYARKELAEHEEVERGNRVRLEEATSRRQRRREEKLARERDEEGAQQDVDGESAIADEEDDVSVAHLSDRRDSTAIRDHEGTQEFLAMRNQQPVNAAHAESAPSGDETTLRSGRGSSTRTRRNLNPPAPLASSFFFYQASSGQNIYLHPLDIKIMLSAFGSYSAFPETLNASIQGADEGSMNDDMRKRCKYLAHLTQGADIVFVEVNWEKMAKEAEARGEEAPVGKSVLRMYEQPLAQRRNRRRDKERKEDRAKSRYEEQERAKRPPMTTSIGAGRGAFAGASRSPNLSPADMFPSSLGSTSSLTPSVQEALLLSTEENGAGEVPSDAHHVGSPSNESNASTGQNHAPRTNGSAPINMSRTVWGTPAAKNSGFADALHNSTRARSSQHDDNDTMADFDAWFELEEDFIMGTRNDRTVREGRGLNRQVKGGQTNGASHPAPAPRLGSSAGAAQSSPPKVQAYQPNWRPSSSPSKAEATAGDAAQEGDAAGARGKGGKQQRKKKFVLTSGGRGQA